MKKTTEDHSEDVRGMVKKTTEDLWEEAADSFNRLETFRNLAIQNERECAEPFGYWFKQERRFADLEEAERYFYVGETRELLKPLFTFPPAPQASVIPSSFESECWKEANNYLTAAVRTEIERKVLMKGLPPAPQHTLYKDGDAHIPTQIVDRNGQVTLGLCKVCGKAESELDEPCRVPQPCPDCENLRKELQTDRLLKTVRYLVGIAERGAGTTLPDDQTVETFVLGYVKGLEDLIKEQAARIKELEGAIERMRVAGGSAEFHRMFELAKDLL